MTDEVLASGYRYFTLDVDTTTNCTSRAALIVATVEQEALDCGHDS